MKISEDIVKMSYQYAIDYVMEIPEYEDYRSVLIFPSIEVSKKVC